MSIFAIGSYSDAMRMMRGGALVRRAGWDSVQFGIELVGQARELELCAIFLSHLVNGKKEAPYAIFMPTDEDIAAHDWEFVMRDNLSPGECALMLRREEEGMADGEMWVKPSGELIDHAITAD